MAQKLARLKSADLFQHRGVHDRAKDQNPEWGCSLRSGAHFRFKDLCARLAEFSKVPEELRPVLFHYSRANLANPRVLIDQLREA